MPSDETTFMLAFFAIFGLILAYIWRLDRLAKALEAKQNRNEMTASDKKQGKPPTP